MPYSEKGGGEEKQIYTLIAGPPGRERKSETAQINRPGLYLKRRIKVFSALVQNPVYKKVRDFFILDPESEDYREQDHIEEFEQNGKVVPINRAGAKIAVSISDPTTTADAKKATDELRQNKIVIANISRLEAGMQKEYLHFLSGATYALDGNCKKVGPGVFLFSPNSIPITDLEELISEKEGGRKGVFIDDL